MQPAASDWRETLYDYLLRPATDRSRAVYAVLDGAQFDDLPAELRGQGLAHRSLYVDVADDELILAGPWLVDLHHLRVDEDVADLHEEKHVEPRQAAEEPDDETLYAQADALAQAMRISVEAGDETGGGRLVLQQTVPLASKADPAIQLEKVLAVVGDKPAATFWVGEASLAEPVIWRHLRTLNRVLIPQGYGEDDKGPSTLPISVANGQEGGGKTHEAVLFRHCDGNVLAAVLPALDASQFTRLFGPARALAFHAPDHPTPSGSFVWRALAPDGTSAAPAGMLQIDADQMHAVEEARQERSRRKVVAYLRDVDPASTEGRSDAELHKAIRCYENTGNAYGLTSERAHMKWAYLMSVSDGDIDNAPQTREFFRQSSKHPDDRIDDLMDLADKAWKQAGGAR